MTETSKDKWDAQAEQLEPELRSLLKELKKDYEEASKTHVPRYRGGPNAGILAELIRRGWRKPR